jgi:hypothetical protein
MRDQAHTTRGKRLWVRLTVEEFAHVKSAAAARGLTAADFIRAAILRGDRRRSRVSRHFLAADVACTIRELSRIANHVNQLLTIAESGGMIAQNELHRCVSEVHAAMAGFAK